MGLLGGSFDPVHHGHLLIAQDAWEQAQLDQVWFIPAAQSPLKATAPVASDMARVALLRAAIGKDPRFAVFDWELSQPPPSYSLRTAEELHRQVPEAELFWIIGEDQFGALGDWHRIGELARLVTFLVIARPGWEARGASPVADLRWERLAGHEFAVSSREIRERVRTGKPIDFLCPSAVVDSIAAQRLYSSAPPHA